MLHASHENPYSGGNAVLDALPQDDARALLVDVRMGHADAADLLLIGGGEIHTVYFPIDGLFSVTAQLRDGSAYEVGTIGREGIVGAELAMGSAASARSMICQVDGTFASLPHAAFVTHLGNSEALRQGVRRAFAEQLFAAEQSVACNTAHHVSERAARWVLMIAHQIGREDFVLRREFLAMMLALPEPAAVQGIATLAYMGAVRYENERVTILDRARLLEVACECFETQRRYRAAIASSHDGTVPPRR